MLSAGERPLQAMNGAAKDIPKPAFTHNSSYNSNMWKTEKSSQKTVQHIWIITGPAGSGKSTVGRGLQTELELPFLEGDDVSFPHALYTIFPWSKPIGVCILMNE